MTSLRIAWIAVRELVHERFFYLLAAFAIASFGFSLLLGQMTYAEQSKLTLDFMLGTTHGILVLFAIFMGVSLFQRELQSGSISMILSKPISRASFLLGKFLGQIGVQAIMAAIMATLTIAFCSRLSEDVPIGACIQTVTLLYLESVVLTALTYTFAVFTGTLTTALITVALFCLGHLRGMVQSALTANSAASRLTRVLIPDLETFNTKSLASYGQTLGAADFQWAIGYAAVCLTLYLTLAIFGFSRKDIAT